MESAVSQQLQFIEYLPHVKHCGKNMDTVTPILEIKAEE